ncbi:MAG: hypothetical protein O3A21_01795, partial [Proteobacteria bacterium]|nr:hypothetical protein [Pseudomonadota bacterium]
AMLAIIVNPETDCTKSDFVNGLLTPLTYLALARFVRPRAHHGVRLERELLDAETIPDQASIRPAE